MILALLASALLSATIGLGVLAMRQGLDRRRERNREIAQHYYERGEEHLQSGNYLLALAELDEAVRLAPDHAEAHQQLAVVQALVEGWPVSSSGSVTESVTVLFEEARALCAEEQWEEAIAKLEQLRRVDANYRSQDVQDLLFNAYYQRARAFIEAGELEHALSDTDSALQIKPSDPSASEQRRCLSLYLVGLTQWGADWDSAVKTFQSLYELRPDFLDVAQRLHDAYVNLGDVYYAEKAWCVAQSQYESALRIMSSTTATAKRDEAGELCVTVVSVANASAMATALPIGTPTPTVTDTPVGAAGVYVGRVVGYVGIDPVEMRVRVRVVDSHGEGVPGAEVRISIRDWTGDAKLTDGNGYCGFAGLTEEADFTVELTQVPCAPVAVPTRWGEEAQVEFVER